MTPVRSLAVMVAALSLIGGTPAIAQTPPPAKPDAAPVVTTPAAAPKPASVPAKRFASAEEATQALVTAVRAGDVKSMVGVLGSEEIAAPGRVPIMPIEDGDPIARLQ